MVSSSGQTASYLALVEEREGGMMEPAVNVMLLWGLFAATHIGLSIDRPRKALIARFGPWGFIGMFSAVASVAYVLLIHYFATHRLEGLPALGLASVELVRWPLYGVAALGAAIMGMALFDYPGSAYAVEAKVGDYQPRGVSRISRHGFFAGLALLSLAHVLLAAHLVGVVFFACVVTFTWVGSIHQDARLTAERGATHERFVAATSFLPFVAILSGRQRLVAAEIPLRTGIAGVVMAALLLTVHDSIFAAGGAYAIAVTLGGAALASLQAWRMQQRKESFSHTKRYANGVKSSARATLPG